MSAVAVAIVGGVATLGSALIGSDASSNAANAQVQAANTASQTQLQMFNQTQANEAPYLQAGGNSLTALMQGLGLTQGTNGAVANGSLTAPFNYQASPGYGYEVNQMMQGVQNSAAARGGLVSGNAMQALQQNAQGLSSTDYYKALAANQAQQNQNYNMLQTLAGSGQNAAANLGALGSGVANQIGSNTIQAGNASAAGTVAGANSLSNLLNNQSFINGIGSMFGGGSSLGAYTPSADVLSGGGITPTYANPMSLVS